MWIDSCVLHPGSAAQLRGERIVCVFKTSVILLVMHFVKIFRQVSKRVMERVWLRLFSHALGFGMGYMLPLLQSSGVSPVLRISLKSLVMWFVALGPNFLKTIYGICEGPGAEELDLVLMTLFISSVVNGCKDCLYQFGSTVFIGGYSSFHSG